MTHTCPLPVDWLDYIQGPGDTTMTRHLEDCGSCRTLLTHLQSEQPTSTGWAAPFLGATDAVWTEDRPAKPAPAEFWFSAPNFEPSHAMFAGAGASVDNVFSYRNVDRALVLIIDAPVETHDTTYWLDVVPVLSDIEAATDTDLLLTTEESTLGSPWRAVFAHQCKVTTAQLDTRVGALTDIGAATLTDALEGTVGEDRWGVALQGPDDPRARLDEHLEQAFLRLRTPWLLATETAEQQSKPKRKLIVVPDRPGTEHSHHAEDVSARVLWLKPVTATDQAHEFALAAASTATAAARTWVLDHELLVLHGTLDMDYQHGLLVFLITAATVKRVMQVRMAVLAHGNEYHSDPFTPHLNLKVCFASGVTRQAVERLGAEILS